MHEVAALPIGSRLGDFEIGGIVHRGDAGFVYLGIDHASQSKIALKEYLPVGLADRMADGNVGVVSLRYQPSFREGLQGFLKQARLLAELDEPALVRVLRTWQERGTAYVAMPWHEGPTLNDTFRASSPPTEAWLKAMLGPLLDALAALHRSGCYPCDVTPENVIVGDGGPLLFDVGIVRRILARAARGRVVVRDPDYAAIEQHSRDPTMPEGPWTDIYAVAAVLRRAIAGTPPPSPLTRVDSDNMPPLREGAQGYSESFLNGVDLGLGVRPQQRPLSIAEFREALGIRSLERSAISIPVRQPASLMPDAVVAPTSERAPPPRSEVRDEEPARKTVPRHAPAAPKKAAQQAQSSIERAQKASAKKPAQRRPPLPAPEQAPQPARAKDSTPALAEQAARRRPVPWTAGALLIVAGLVGAGLFWAFGKTQSPSQVAAESAPTISTPTREPTISTPTREASTQPVALPDVPAPAVASAVATAEAAPSDNAAPVQAVASPPIVVAAPTAPAAVAPKSGTIHFAVRPWGEIVIDGKKRGVSPPIKELSIPEGRHRIEIRNSDFPVHASDVDVGAGRKVSIAHSFGSP